MKSVVLTPVPPVVVTVSLPDAALPGTVKVKSLELETVAAAATPFTFTTVAPDAGSKFDPETDIVEPEMPEGGVKLVIVGADGSVTTKSEALVAVAPPTVRVIRPVEAPAGTLVTSEPLPDAVTDAATPLKATELLTGMGSNPAP
jgi:hypothetical protein